MSRNRGLIVVDTERCKGCGLCVEACPLHLLTLSDKAVNMKGYSFAVQADWERCNGCTSCAVVCPDACISVYRKREEVEGAK
ncbi:MAG: ferredoxin family protein [Bacteroidaceae bacterium]|nr:ferredoxin family protein [Bacteroidaceae bacterium]